MEFIDIHLNLHMLVHPFQEDNEEADEENLEFHKGLDHKEPNNIKETNNNRNYVKDMEEVEKDQNNSTMAYHPKEDHDEPDENDWEFQKGFSLTS